MWERRDNSTHPVSLRSTEINSSAKIENTLAVLRPAVYCERRRFRKIVVKKLRRSFRNLTVRSVLRLILQPSPLQLPDVKNGTKFISIADFTITIEEPRGIFSFFCHPFPATSLFFLQPAFLKCLTNPQKVYWNS